MPLEAWLPIGQPLPEGGRAKLALYQGQGWQILETDEPGRALLVKPELANRWAEAGLLDESAFQLVVFGNARYTCLWSSQSHILAPVAQCESPRSQSETLAFALAMKATRSIDGATPLQDALYVERFSRLLPTYSISSRTPDDIVLGYWLSGGAHVSVKSFRRMRQMLNWLEPAQLKETIEAAGFNVDDVVPSTRKGEAPANAKAQSATARESEKISPREAGFKLPGRPELESFFNEHVVDIVKDQARYQALGIGFPSAVILHGPPGCGKTFAVEQLVEYLGWPSFSIEASTVASPYIHETSKKVASVFEKAIESAPSVLVIDEMEGFLADRQMGVGASHHRVEEVGEFLRRIPEATKKHVLVIAMTNRIEMIDPAILRRGRFDHVLKVDMASEEEIEALLRKLMSEIPSAKDVEVKSIAKRLAGRPLSDVAFAVREGARLAARAGKSAVDQASLLKALESTSARGEEPASARKIGFV
jgi:cell division protease FtsH